MGQGLQPLGKVDKMAIALRRWPAIHRIGRFFRSTFKIGLIAGFWEFARILFADFSFGPPRGRTSVYRALRAKWPPIRGRIHLEDQGVPIVTEDCVMVKSGFMQYAEQPWPVFWSEHHQAELVEESLAYLMPDKTLCVESVYNEGFWRQDHAARYFRLPPPVELKGNWTSIVSYWVPNIGVPIYGHWFHDALPRLGFLPEFPPDTGILVPPDLKPYHRESLELWGVWDRCRPTPERHLIVENYFFSSPTALIDCYDPYGRQVVRDNLLPKRDRTYHGPKKFYMHRSGKRRALANGEEVCAFFRSKGWDIVIDVELTVAQTLTLFSEAEALCSLVGSNLANMLFCSPGCTVMNMVTDSHIEGWVEWLAQEGKLDYHSHIFPVGGPFTTEIVIEPAAIEKFFADSGVPF